MIEDWTLLIDQLPGFATSLGFAVLCGIILGIERERKDKPAGLRTIMLITVGSTLYMLVSRLVPIVQDVPADFIRIDPGRIAAQVISGIGFLGAGTIIHARGSVQGLTTAAVIWTAAGIGLCIGIGFPILAFSITLLIVTVLVLLEPLRTWLSRKGPWHVLELTTPNDQLVVRRVELILVSHEIRTRAIQWESLDIPDRLFITIRHQVSGSALQRMLGALAQIEGVQGLPHLENGLEAKRGQSRGF